MAKQHPSARRKPEDKKEADDPFVEKTLEVVTWAKANSQLLVLAGIVAVVAVAGIVYYRSYRVSLEQQAVAQLEVIQQTLGFGDPGTARSELGRYLERFKGTPYALEARLLLGQVHLEQGEMEEAIEVLAPVVRSMGREPLGTQAAFLLAAAYEEAGRTQDAERLFLRIADAAGMTFQVRDALSSAARIRSASGDLQGAIEILQDVLATFDEDDPQRGPFEMRLAELSARRGT